MRQVHEDLPRPHVDVVASSERWGVEKPSPAFFECVREAAGFDAPEVAYVRRIDSLLELL